MSTDIWVDKEDIYMREYYWAIKKDGVIRFALTWLQVEIIILSKVSKSEKERQMPYDITCMWNLKYGLVYKAETKSQAERTDLQFPRERDGRGLDWEFGVSRCKLLHIE